MPPYYAGSRFGFALRNNTQSGSGKFASRVLAGIADLLASTRWWAKADKEYTSPSPGAAMYITDDCVYVDPVMNHPCIDVDEMRATPVPHRFVPGGFDRKDARSCMAFPLPVVAVLADGAPLDRTSAMQLANNAAE